MTALDDRAARVAALTDDQRERIAYVENIRAVLALPPMQATDRTTVRRAVFVERPDGEPMRVLAATAIEVAAGIEITLDHHGGVRVLSIAPTEPLPEWWTALVPA